MIGALLSEFLPYIIGAVGLLGGLWGYGRHKEGKGADKARQEAAEATQKAIQKREKDRDDVQALDDTSLADRITRGG